MSVFELIKGRRTVHNYEPNEPISEDVLRQALELAMWSPNHKLTFPWFFYWVGVETRQKLAELSVQLKQEKAGSPLSAVKKSAIAAKVLNPSALIVFSQKRASDAFTAKEDYAAMACAIQNFSLYLWDQGYGSKWSSGTIMHHPKTYKMLGIDQNNEEIVGFVWVGKPERIPPAAGRPPLDERLKKLD